MAKQFIENEFSVRITVEVETADILNVESISIKPEFPFADHNIPVWDSGTYKQMMESEPLIYAHLPEMKEIEYKLDGSEDTNQFEVYMFTGETEIENEFEEESQTERYLRIIRLAEGTTIAEIIVAIAEYMADDAMEDEVPDNVLQLAETE